MDKVYRREVLAAAWERVPGKHRAADVDRMSVEPFRGWIAANGLCVHPDKTHLGHCLERGQGFAFLGYRFYSSQDRSVSAKTRPSPRAAQAIRWAMASVFRGKTERSVGIPAQWIWARDRSGRSATHRDGRI